MDYVTGYGEGYFVDTETLPTGALFSGYGEYGGLTVKAYDYLLGSTTIQLFILTDEPWPDEDDDYLVPDTF